MAKSIFASVGQGGVNRQDDTLTVQFLLNCVPLADGGPAVELVLDGLVGPKTIGAIQHFQRTQFGWLDGRVDPENQGGITIVRLNDFDPLPEVPLPPLGKMPQLPGGQPHGKRPRGKKVTIPKGKKVTPLPQGKKVTLPKGKKVTVGKKVS